jgi:hypothetical protein
VQKPLYAEGPEERRGLADGRVSFGLDGTTSAVVGMKLFAVDTITIISL